MERLTERFSNGQAAVYGCGNNCKHDFKYCETYNENCPTMVELYEKLAAYEDAEEQGMLIRLPHPLGTELYFPFKCQGVIKDRIRRWQLNKNGLFFCSYAGNAYRFEAIGKTVFLTREEAEAALAEMEE